MLPLPDLDRFSHAELKSLVVKQWQETAELRRMVAALRDEIARLKGGPVRPNIKPSGMERATEPKPAGSSGNKRAPRGSTRSKLSIRAEQTIIKVAAPPAGSRFKGYTSVLVQDLVIRSHVVNFRCERWQTPDGKMMTAPLPAGIHGHFGPELRRFVLAQYHQGQVTAPRLVTLLQAFGILISKRQVMRLLIDRQDGSSTRLATCSARACRAPPGLRWMTLVRATKPATASAHRWAMNTSPGSGPRPRRAASTSSSCCAPATAITSSMPRR
jgi:hypothetical protein